MQAMEFIYSLPSVVRIVAILVLAVLAHFVVRGLKRLSQWLLSLKLKTDTADAESFTRRYPKLATLTTIFVSAATFVIYFFAVGLVLREFKVSLTAYLASASVIGLAIGFGLQGAVQDVVIGLTLIFSDALNVEELVEISGQIGKVENIGLRFTTLVNFYGQKIYVPNRNITTISRFRRGAIRAYVDIQIPEGQEPKKTAAELHDMAKGIYHQHKAIILESPELFAVRRAESGGWQYARIKFRVWPGQGTLIETAFKQRIVARMKDIDPDYADWMVAVTYRVE
ncbi:MAG: mechanosensitive ion channel [Deltaproteobacteria bacterium]|nr:mechanosensitive ion channel [Deltaproteobacteria bacterium]